MNVTLFRNRVFANRMSLRRGDTGLGWPLNPTFGALIRRERETQRHTGKKTSEDGLGDWCYAAISQETPRIACQ